MKSDHARKDRSQHLGEGECDHLVSLKDLRAGKGTKCDIGGQLERAAAMANRPVELAFAFLPYAKAHVLTHTKELFECDINLDFRFCKNLWWVLTLSVLAMV